MAVAALPEGGFTLPPPFPSGKLSNGSSGLPQIIRLDLSDGLLHDVIKAARHGKNPLLSFGKTIVSSHMDNDIHFMPGQTN